MTLMIGVLGHRTCKRVNGSKVDDIRNDALYKKIGTNFIDVTPGFQYVDFIGNYLQSSYFNYANCQGAYFNYKLSRS